MSMPEERRAPQIAVAQPVMDRIGALPEDQAEAVRAAIRTIGTGPGEFVDLPTAPFGYPYRARHPHDPSAPVVIYRESRQDEPGDWLVVSLMTPEEFRQQKRDELSDALRNPYIRRNIANNAGTAATTVSTHFGGVHFAPTGGALPTAAYGVPDSDETYPIP